MQRETWKSTVVLLMTGRILKGRAFELDSKLYFCTMANSSRAAMISFHEGHSEVHRTCGTGTTCWTLALCTGRPTAEAEVALLFEVGTEVAKGRTHYPALKTRIGSPDANT